MKKAGTKKPPTLTTLTKSNVWDVQESDIFRMLESIDKDADTKNNARHYIDIMRTAFTIEQLTDDMPSTRSRYEKQGYKVTHVKLSDETGGLWAVKKRPIVRVSDLTYENIHHITAAKLIDVLDRNFGGGWDSLSQSIKDIIESGFDISTTTLPKDRLHKPGGMYEKKVADGYDVLEVQKGTWVEAIFAKTKPEAKKPRLTLQAKNNEDLPEDDDFAEDDEDDDVMEEPTEFSDDDITEDNYRTTFEIDGDPDEEAGNLSDFDTDD